MAGSKGGRPVGGRIGREVRDRFWLGLLGGASIAGASAAAGVAYCTGREWYARIDGVDRVAVQVAPEPIPPSSGRLSFAERCVIEDLLDRGFIAARIAGLLGRARSTISRELRRGGWAPPMGGRYRARVAQRFAAANLRRPKTPKLVAGNELFIEVAARLSQSHSPVQAAGRLRSDFPDRPEMWVSHETIYQALYVESRGALKAEIKKALRSGRSARKPRGRTSRGPYRQDLPSIHDRPEEVEGRLVPGHWEGDLIMGADNLSAIGTLVERTTGFVMLLHLPDNHTSAVVVEAMTAAIARLPEQIWRSLTWDRGSEMAQHARITELTCLAVYFADPHSPWQRGSNENTNGLLRQYFPKATDLSFYGSGLLDQVAAELNNRPRKRHQFRTPAELMDELLHSPDQQSVALTP